MTQDNQNSDLASHNSMEMEEDEINLIDLLLVLLKWKRMIFWIVAASIVISVIVALISPKSYIATARILPPQESKSSMSGLLSQVGGTLGGLGLDLIGGESTSDVYVGILESRTVADNLIKKYDLMERYDTKYMADTYEELSERSAFDVDSKNQIISISVEDRDPQIAADMANTYVEELDIINRTVNITEGQRKRIFLEKRLAKVKEDLINAEMDLKAFQEQYKLVSIDEQARVAIEGAAEIKAMIIIAQTELEVLKDFGTEKQNEAVMLQARITELQKQLARIESGSSDKDIDDFYIPFSELPDLGMQLARLTREFKIQENVFELLSSQYELAKIEEAKDVNTIQVLDRAVPPDKRSKPKRKIIVILTTFVAFFFSVFLAFFLEFVEKVRSEDEERYNSLIKHFKDIDWEKHKETLQRYKEYLETRIKTWRKK
jgi:tyrosine-protein kinase Etk/Wzc